MWYEDHQDEQPYRLRSQKATLDRQPDADGEAPLGQEMSMAATAAGAPVPYKPKVKASSEPGTEYWLP